MFDISRLAVPAVSLLIAFLAYSSQMLYLYIAPHPLTRDQTIKVNLLAACIWVSYYKACTADPGSVPPDWVDAHPPAEMPGGSGMTGTDRLRWCRRCKLFKPPRAHHCKTCNKCIPKMDHHCPWTANCVSHFTYPHFLRFVFYDVVGLAYNEHLLYIRVLEIWHDRTMPSVALWKYLGPSVFQLAHLFILVALNTLALTMLSILLLRTLWLCVQNITTIESWEIERHEMLVRRARASGGYLSAPDGNQIRIRKQEFPYDLGFFKNVKEAMGGSANVLKWVWPFSDVPSWNKGVFFETNGFEDDNVTWPPPDPDRMARSRFIPTEDEAFTYLEPSDDPQSRMEAFRRRQQDDLLRRRIVPPNDDTGHKASGIDDLLDDAYSGTEVSFEEDLEHWTNSEGERLRDFGVDEEVDLGDEDDLPLAKVMERRQQAAAEQRSRH